MLRRPARLARRRSLRQPKTATHRPQRGQGTDPDRRTLVPQMVLVSRASFADVSLGSGQTAQWILRAGRRPTRER